MIKLSENTFFRSVDEDQLLYNPRTEAGCVIKNAFQLLSRLQQGVSSIDNLCHELSCFLDADETMLKSDYSEIIKSLIDLELVTCDGKQDGCTANGLIDQKSDDMDPADIIEPFYELHGLVSELHIDLTDDCTEKCVHCYYPCHGRSYISLECVKKVLSEFRDAQGLTVYISGGECMLHPKFLNICEYCREIGLNFIILSNLTLCDEKTINALRTLNPQFINVSLYSMESEIHDKITRVKGSWEKTMRAILGCKEVGLHIRVATPLLKTNRKSFGEIKSFCDLNRLHFVPDYNIFARTDHSSDNLDFACSISELEETLNDEFQIFKPLIENCYRNESDCRVCRIGHRRIYVDFHGNYYPCDAMHDYKLGSVYDNALLEIWRGRNMKLIREMRLKDLRKCVGCEDRKYCLICPAQNYNATGDMLVPNQNKCQVAKIVGQICKKRL